MQYFSSLDTACSIQQPCPVEDNPHNPSCPQPRETLQKWFFNQKVWAWKTHPCCRWMKGSEVCKNHHPFHSCANSWPHSCPTLPRMLLLPIIFPTATAGQDLTITKLLKQTQQHLAHRLYQVPAALPQIHLDKEEKTGCVMLGMSHTPLAQPALAFEQGGKQVPEQRAAAACSHPARSWSIQPASVLHFQQLGGNRDLPILAQKRGTWSVYPEFLGMSAEIPKLQKIYCRSSDVTFTQEHTSWQ